MAGILHLEDDESLREIFRLGLLATDSQINLHQFINSDDAIRFITDHTDEIDLYLLDIRVPGTMDGMRVAEAIRDQGITRPIIISSAYRRPDRALLNRLDCRWVAKPWDVLDIGRTIIPLLRNTPRL